MPLRDHFRPPLDDIPSWEGFHGQWLAMIVAALNRQLPPRYAAEPRVHLGASTENDVSANNKVVTDPPDQYEYEVRVYERKPHRRLVAAVEIVSPGNKDRPESRRAFVTKCAGLLQQRVSVAIVDLVTTRQFNLYRDLLELIGQTDPALEPEPPSLYAAACHLRHPGEAWRFQAWTHTHTHGPPQPTQPRWLADDLAVPLETGSQLRGDLPHPPPGVSRGRLLTHRRGRSTAVRLTLPAVLLVEGSTEHRRESLPATSPAAGHRPGDARRPRRPDPPPERPRCTPLIRPGDAADGTTARSIGLR